MNGEAVLFWENVKNEVKRQNTTQEWAAKKAGISFHTFQGWIAKGIYPRVDDAMRIAIVLNTSVEYLVSGTLQDNKTALERIYQNLPKIYEHLKIIREAARELK